MQKQWLILFLVVLASCTPDIRYTAEDTVVHTTGADSFHAQVRVDLQEKMFTTPLGVQVHGFGAFEVYWDSCRVGQNGVPASPGHPEVPGTENSYYQIPDSLSAPGPHVVDIKGTQTWLKETGRAIMAKPESYLKLLRQPLLELSLVNLMAGAFLIAGIYYIFLYFNSHTKTVTTFLFALICLLFFLLLAAEYIKFYIDIPYTRFYMRLTVVGWLTFATSALTPCYFAIYYRLPYTRLFTAVLLVALLSIYAINYGHYDLTAYLYSITLWFASVLALLYAGMQRQKGALLVLAGFALSMLVTRYVYYDFGLYISFTIILLCILYLQTLSARQLEQAHQSSQLLSARLQLELVKKNIQPHFLRNTLTSLMDWVEESPAEGVHFIKALSAEFDIMMEMSDETLVPVQREIALCKQHIAVMQYRREVMYTWEEQGIDSSEHIPPAILLTLAENGITHSIPVNNQIHFLLRFRRTNTGKEYIFETYGQNRVTERTGGNGFRYVQARLAESYGNRWKFIAAPFSGGWRNTIYLYE